MHTLPQTAAPHEQIEDENNFMDENTIRRDKSIVAVLGQLQTLGQSEHPLHFNVANPLTTEHTTFMV